MLEINEVIVVEGRDDTAAINRAVKATTIETHGFGMSEKMWQQIENAYRLKGIIIFTDPDYAGGKIRRTLLEKFPDSKQAFLSQEAAYKKGDIGIENASPKDIIEALQKAKCTRSEAECEYTDMDLIQYQLIGGEGSKERREKLGNLLGIGYGNSKNFLKKLNSFGIPRDEFEEKVKEL